MTRLLSLAQRFLRDMQIPDVPDLILTRKTVQDSGTVMGALHRVCFGETPPLFAPELH